jgi:hypothetical protein
MNTLFGPEDDSVGKIHDQLLHLLKIKNRMPPALAAPGRAQLLTREQVSMLVDAAFWASLRLNEGRITCFSVTVTAPESSCAPLLFADPVPYDESQIAKLAPALPQGGCIGVSREGDELGIWGFCRVRPGSWLDAITVDVWEPGTVRVCVGPFQPFAVLDGRSNSIMAGSPNFLADYLRLVLGKLLPTGDILETQAVWRECLALKDLARMTLAEGHGGAVLIVPNETGTWLESLKPFAYKLASPDTTIPDLIRMELDQAQAQGETLHRLSATDLEEELKASIMAAMGPRSAEIGRRIGAIASLAGVDGAIVITRDLQLVGFGAKIAVGGDVTPQVRMYEPGSQEGVCSPFENLGGTRHQSAARFAGRNRDTVALVISQDRYLSVMHWDEGTNSVSVLRKAEWRV